MQHHGPTLEVNVKAIARNWALLKGKTKSGRCGAVVKADAYGLGANHVAPALYNAGAREFFVATLGEGMGLRKIMPMDAIIYVFHGARAGEVTHFTAHRLIPVLSSREQIAGWNFSAPAALHVDTGMRRLGLAPDEIGEAAKGKWALLLSHLACANEPEHPLNKIQLESFREAQAHFSGVATSLANSSGIFLGDVFHGDLVRPGCSLYGISPNTALPNPMENVVTLSAPILQYRSIAKAESVGYGATAKAPAGSVLATVEIGYADGFLRCLSNVAHGFAAGVRVPLLGRVSMDMIIFDVSEVPEFKRTPELRVTLIGEEQPVDMLAKDAGTIGYEIFTRLGARVKRAYI